MIHAAAGLTAVDQGLGFDVQSIPLTCARCARGSIPSVIGIVLHPSAANRIDRAVPVIHPCAMPYGMTMTKSGINFQIGMRRLNADSSQTLPILPLNAAAFRPDTSSTTDCRQNRESKRQWKRLRLR